MNKVRIQNSLGNDIVVIDMDTGSVSITGSASDTAINEAAKLWWSAVTLVHARMAKKTGKVFRDLVMRAIDPNADTQVHDGDITISPGHNGHAGQIDVRPALLTALPRDDAGK